MQKKLFLLVIISVFSILINAQTLIFDKKYVDCIDKWVAISVKEKNEYILGFVYFDEEAGLTLDYSRSAFKISETGEFVLGKNMEETRTKVRLEPNKNLVAIIPENKFEELKISAEPNWLKNYKKNSNTAEYLYSKGFMYNAWGKCDLALSCLEEASKIEKDYNLALIAELAYTYNCLEQYDNVPYIIHSNTKDAYALKELIYAQVHLGQLETAGENCLKYIKNVNNKVYAAENFYNLVVQYYERKDKKNFNYWAKYAKKWAKDTKITSNNEIFLRNIKIMEQEMKNLK